MNTSFTLGCDPEIFVKNKRSQKIVSAHGLIEGDKKAPHKIPEGAYQVDGMAVEFNTDPYDLSRGSSAVFSRRVLNVMDQMKASVQAKDKDLTFAIQATADFDPEYLEAQPEEAKELGCDPDFNAYTLEQNPRPNGEVPFRTAAGHIHLGWTEGAPIDHPDHLAICASIVKCLDATVGFASVIYERDTRRREMYGCAGAFRPKPYGVEYRTPSNFWIANHNHRQSMFLTVKQTVSTLRSCGGDEVRAIGNLSGLTPEEVRTAIDNNNVEAIRERCFGLRGPWYDDFLNERFANVLD
ncbi:MAG: putative COOH.NH2 ligase-type 2 [Prokaryotic dsDNA virus sp.]|uniref:putative amidoligase domain-containing protein n=1 Tax=Thalassospira sp. TaxID=1912094 RepID=UPI000C3CFA28|nr:hypothetical protein [Thalassospira sp.]QDP61011.1 MAG: putative COOH.NH2 ligase-type 2 [Prokaryotic dsDNA virus sp.]MAZ33861.1 hypothetical protein [Thalassospira sp.]MAZ33917.1 hypothetical protein [Thalassospira sp.]MAZ34646.1 hypothetical protein [Thalassospira sp.]QDP64484.1 MAG: putative COOH.NH2 ligase-type 2 [Prokaryotic dsDNA virus sp.]|tara:strand:+ start:6937 stop:7824 length:888 start_codon:yes stop_codon:yes gene_type:complete